MVHDWLLGVNASTGNAVVFDPGFASLPVLGMGAEGHRIPLYRFVEVLEELVNVDRLCSELQGASPVAVYGAFGFLRKLSQFNCSGRDIDDIEDEWVVEHHGDQLRDAVARGEVQRVLGVREGVSDIGKPHIFAEIVPAPGDLGGNLLRVALDDLGLQRLELELRGVLLLAKSNPGQLYYFSQRVDWMCVCNGDHVEAKRPEGT